MAPSRSPSEFVVHVARLYQHGIIGPSEAWNQIHDATVDLDVISLFNKLNNAERDHIRGIHLERPLSLEILAKSNSDSQFPAMLNWCVAACNS